MSDGNNTVGQPQRGSPEQSALSEPPSAAEDSAERIRAISNNLNIVGPAVDELRRLRLRVLLKLMLAAGALFTLYIFMSSFLSNSPDNGANETRRISLASQQPGTMESYNWNGRPVLVLHRTAQQLDSLLLNESQLRDPKSARSRQPEFAVNRQRSRQPQWFVAIAAGTDLSCAIEYLAPEPENFRNLPWPGGFVDSCRGARYDVAGRVYTDQHASKNLSVPLYTLRDKQLILGGE